MSGLVVLVPMLTRDEHRAKCIEAMKVSARNGPLQTNGKIAYFSNAELVELFTAAFDSLHGIVRVDPIEATEEMIDEYALAEWSEDHEDVKSVWRNMSAAGDLTNPLEKQP
jgi:hypothetical protein